MDSEKKPSLARCFVWIILNMVSSVSIVLVNKVLFKDYKFPNLSLTVLHFFSTGLLLFFCERIGVFPRKAVSPLNLLPLTFSFAGFVALTNLSLQLNQVGTYQLLKTLTTPGVVIIGQIVFRRQFSIAIQLTASLIVGGAFFYSYFDIKLNVLGIFIGLLAAIVTSMYQVLVSEKQKQLQMDSMQLLLYQAPTSAVILTLIALVVEPLNSENGLFQIWSPNCLFLVLLSCFLAFLVNLSIFWIIGNTSPLTYNYAGHAKFALIVLSGWIVFHESINPLQLIGIGLTVSGIVAYSHFKMRESKTEKPADEPLLNSISPTHKWEFDINQVPDIHDGELKKYTSN